MSAFRTPDGGRIDRARPVSFSFDGAALNGYRGDTLASALLGNGVHLMGRSFKYHRPRGVVTAGSEEPNALVGVGRSEDRYTPNLRATQVELYDGLTAESQNRFPSLRFDVGQVNDVFGKFLSAGFYYKTFMWPRSAWEKLYEPIIRRAAGLGRAATAADADRYAQRFAHCEILIVGSGPAGLAAALAAAGSGKRVILCDEQSEFGGSLLHEREATIEGRPAATWVAEAIAELASRSNVTLLPRTTAFGYYPHNLVGLAERVTEHLAAPAAHLPRERMWQVRAAEIVFATGSIERPLVFPQNDRPGILMAEAGRTYLNRFGVKSGHRAVVFTANDSAYRAALDLKASGVEIAAIADLRAKPTGPYVERARAAGIPIYDETAVVGTRGRLRVASATLGRIGWTSGETVICDHVLMSGGFTPNISLFSQSRGKMAWDETLGAYIPKESVERERSAGASRGLVELGEVLADGFAAGRAAAGHAIADRNFAAEALPIGREGHRGVVPHRRDPAKVKAFVDFQNDVTAKDVKLATVEGFRSIEHVKRYTTTGMATDQGRLSNINALEIVSKETARPIESIGLTTFRPPYTPTTFGNFAGISRGPLFDPIREAPCHDWAVAQGAAFEDVGLWKRAHYFPRAGEDMHAAVARECRAVRASAGIFDASTLGKIEIAGPDAAEFVDRIYTNPFKKLEIGRLRYGIMLREDGFVMDDGVVARIAEDRFHATTTTGGAPRVLNQMEDYLQTEWPDLKVWLTSTTEQWGVIALQGPRAREILEPLVEDADISREAMPHMSWRDAIVAGVKGRIWRVSFTGELGFEINVPASRTRAVWEAIVARGGAALTPYGTEAMHVLRAEKGYIIVGQETDGTAVPDDVGLAWAVAKKKHDFVGMRSLARPTMSAVDRKQMVGLLTVDRTTILEEGAQIVEHTTERERPAKGSALGHVTSSYPSDAMGRPIALALVKGGRARIGETLDVPMPKGRVAVTIVDPVFIDPKNERLNG